MTDWRTVLRDPDAAFAEPEAVSLSGAVSVVFLLGVLAAAGTIAPALVVSGLDDLTALSDWPTIRIGTGGGATELPALEGVLVAGSILSPFPAALLVGLTLHALAGAVPVAIRVRDGGANALVPRDIGNWLRTGLARVHRTLAMVGWGLLPQALASAVTAALFLPLVVGDPTVEPTAVLLTFPGHTVVTLPGRPIVTAGSHLVGAVCTLWSGRIWVAALVARGHTRRTALVVAGHLTLLLVVSADAGTLP